MSAASPSTRAASWIVLGRTDEGIAAASLDAAGSEIFREPLARDIAGWVGRREASSAVRWVWSDTPTWYSSLLEAGVRVSRCHDLRLWHAVLRDTERVASAPALRAAIEWDVAVTVETTASSPTLFDLEDAVARRPPEDLAAALAEFARQRSALAAAQSSELLRLLLAAESAGALIACELRAAGLPWDATVHDRILTEVLGARGAEGRAPAHVERAALQVRTALGDPAAALDSQPKLLRALHRAGVLVESTSRWELAEHDHPVIEPLLEYKKLTRLLSANAWAWLAEWVHEGRFHPVYVPGGVVTGRWASSGGGALQLPRQLRPAVRADPGWKLVVADVAQLEPRVLAAMARDDRLAAAARGRDLYAGIVESGAVATRADAKVAMLGAMYGATTGDSGRLVPVLRRAYPSAMRLVDDAAAIGERGGVVSTWLGRTSPPPSDAWLGVQRRAGAVDATDADEARARRWARDRGRFTRNFVVQGTAAEWALIWLADLRRRLEGCEPVDDVDAAPRSGEVFGRRPHLAFFLHDELIVHTPVQYAQAVADAVQDAAVAAGRLVFGSTPIDFPLDLRITDAADKD